MKQIKLRGHSIECRINAEDPNMNFAPSPMVITDFHIPGGKGVRMDSHAYAGYEISPHYDSLIGKLIVHSTDRKSVEYQSDSISQQTLLIHLTFGCLIGAKVGFVVLNRC